MAAVISGLAGSVSFVSASDFVNRPGEKVALWWREGVDGALAKRVGRRAAAFPVYARLLSADAAADAVAYLVLKALESQVVTFTDVNGVVTGNLVLLEAAPRGPGQRLLASTDGSGFVREYWLELIDIVG